MKKILFILLLFAHAAFSQNTPFSDSLVNDLKLQLADTGKIKTLSELTFFYATKMPAMALDYARQQKMLADKINIPKFSANAFNDLAIVQYYLGKYPEALQYNKQALALREGLGNKALLVSSLNKIALIYEELGKYDTAATYQFKILKLAEELKDQTFTGITYNNLGYLFKNLKNYVQSEMYARRALAIALTTNNKDQVARAYGNIAGIFENLQQYDSAIAYYNKTLPILTEQDDRMGLANIYNDIGVVYGKNKNNNAALASYRKAYNLATLLGNKSDAAFYATNIGQVLIELGQYPDAFQYFSVARNTAYPDNNLKVLKLAYNGLSNYYFLQGRKDSGLHYQALHQTVVDSMYSGRSVKQIAELQTQYETAKKEQEITLLNKENTIQKLSLSRHRTFILVIISVLLLGVAFSYLIYNRAKIKQEARLQQEVMKQQELATEAVIEAEENERKRIARDLHDGVGQMMSAAKMNLSFAGENIPWGSPEKIAYDKALALVDESCREVRSVSHNMMPNALIKTGLASAIRNFIENIESNSLKVQLYTEGLNESLNKNTESVLYRVLQECVNNVIKHAKASHLDMALIKDDTGINATIEDNGIGFDTSDTEKFTGIGLDNMQKRISFLKGTIEWQSSPGRGTLVAIYIPA